MSVAVVVLLTLLIVVNQRLITVARLGAEFTQEYVAASVLIQGAGSPYSPETMAGAWDANRFPYLAEATEGENRGYPKPLPSLFPLLWLTPLRPQLASAVWLSLVQLCQPLLFLFGLLAIEWRPPWFVYLGGAALSIGWLYGASPILQADPDTVAIALFLAGLAAIRGERNLLAVPLLSLALVGTSLVILPFLFIWAWSLVAKRWPIAVGLPLLLLGMVLIGNALLPGWIIQWLRVVVTNIRSGAISTLLADLGSGLAPGLIGVIMVVVMLWQWALGLGRGPRSFTWTVGLTLATWYLLHPAPRLVGVGILVLPLLLFAKVSTERWSNRGWILVATIALALLLLPWWASANAVQGEEPSRFLTLWIPWIISYLALFWHRWWYLQAPESSYPVPWR